MEGPVSSVATFTFVDPSGRREKATRRQNPDGTIGGWVAASAVVHETAIVEVDAVVEPGVVVEAGRRIKNGQVAAR